MKNQLVNCILTVLLVTISCFLSATAGAQTGSITGKVVDDVSGAVVANLRVAVYESDDNTAIFAQDYTDATTGEYNVTGLGVGDYKVRFITSGTDYIGQWHNGSSDFSGAQVISLTSDSQIFALGETRLILGGKITGTVTYSDATPSASVYVQAHDTDGWAATALVDSATGEYTLTGLATGSYTVFFWAFYTDYVSEWHDNVIGQTGATSVSVTKGVETPGIDAELMLGDEISGAVSDGDGNPIEGALVLVYDSNDSDISRGFTTAAGDGSYTVTGLPPMSMTFKVQFFEREGDGSGAGLTEWYNDKFNFVSADTVSTGATGIDATLESNINWFIFTPALTHRPTP